MKICVVAGSSDYPEIFHENLKKNQGNDKNLNNFTWYIIII